MGKKAVYRWTSDLAFPKVDPQAAGERLEAIRLICKRGLTPEVVVRDAKHKESPLHRAFEWDDSRAAQKYRLGQAGDLIRSIAVVVEASKPGDGSKNMRAFVNVETKVGRHYTSLAVAMAEPELRKQVLQRAFRELQGWRERYEEYNELAAIFGAMDKVARKIAS